jgi:hypothetical protein
MTLREKFNELHQSFINGDFIATDLIKEECEEIADEFAIGFAEWCLESLLNGEEPKADTIKELLEIYKKEKGL